MAKQKKGFIALDHLVGMLLVLFVIVVLLVSTGLYKTILNMFAKDTLCEASFIVSAMSRPLLQIGNPAIDPECQVNKIIFVNKKKDEIKGDSMQAILETNYATTLPDQKWDTFTRVKEWNAKCGPGNELPESAKYPYFEEYAQEVNGGDRSEIIASSATSEQKEYVRKRYNMDKVFAEEMKRCWDIVGQGELPLFENWFTLIDCDENKSGVQKCNTLGDWVSAVAKGKVKDTANFCVLCSRLKFDEEVSNEFQGLTTGKYSSLSRWMGNNPKRVGESMSYYEYIYNPDKMGSFAEQGQPEYSTDKPYAVVFERVNQNTKSGATLISLGFIKYDDEDVYYQNRLVLIPYEDISKECDYLVASTI